MTAPENELAKPKTGATPPPAPKAKPSDSDLNKIRNILFGESVQELRDFVASLDRSLTERIDALREDLESTRTTLEDRIDTAIDGLRGDSTKSLEEVRGDVHSRFESLSAKLEDAVAGMRSKGMSKSQLSKLLGELAHRIVDGQDDDDENH